MNSLNNFYSSIDELPLVISVEQLTSVLGIGRNTAYNMVRSGAIKSLRIGTQYKIPKNALIAYLDGGGN